MNKKISRGSKPNSLTYQVVEFIKNQIDEGELKSGEYLISERSLSQLIGVSRVTVRRGLAILVKDKIIEKKPKEGYVYIGTSLRTSLKKQKAILFIHQHDEKRLSSDEQVFSIWEGARLEAKENDLFTMVRAGVKTISKKMAKELSLISCGVVTDLIDQKSIKNLVEQGLVIIHLDYYMGSFVDNILQDDYGGMIDGVENLIKNKCRNISYFSTFKSLKEKSLEFNSEIRLSGFKTVLERHNISLSKTSIIEVESKGDDIAERVGEILNKTVDAMVFPHNYLFDQSIEIIERSTLKNIPILVWGRPQRSHNLNVIQIVWDAKSMGREAVKRVMLRLFKPKIDTVKVLISCKLIKKPI